MASLDAEAPEAFCSSSSPASTFLAVVMGSAVVASLDAEAPEAFCSSSSPASTFLTFAMSSA